MDVNSKEAELWSETMRLKSLVEHKEARIERLEAALTGAETVMMIVEPRSHKAEYLTALAAIKAALAGQEG